MQFVPHDERLLGAAEPGEHPRERAEHDGELRAMPCGERGGGVCDSRGELCDRRATGESPADGGGLRELPCGIGIEHREPAGGQRREVQRLVDESYGDHEQLRVLPRTGDHREQLCRGEQYRGDAGDESGGDGVAHPLLDDLRELSPGDGAEWSGGGVGDEECAGDAVRDTGADDDADPHGDHLGLFELPRHELCLDGDERLPDRPVGAHQRCAIHRLPDAAEGGGRDL